MQGLFYVEICFNSASQKDFLVFPSPYSITFVSLLIRPLPQLSNKGKFRAKILTTSPRLFHFLYTSKMGLLDQSTQLLYYKHQSP